MMIVYETEFNNWLLYLGFHYSFFRRILKVALFKLQAPLQIFVKVDKRAHEH